MTTKTYKELTLEDGKAMEVTTTDITTKQTFKQDQLISRKAQLQVAIDEIDTILTKFK